MKVKDRFPWWPEDWFCLEHGARGGANRCRLKKYMPNISECDMIEVLILPAEDHYASVEESTKQ